MPYKDPEARRAWDRRNKEKTREYSRAYRERHPQRYQAKLAKLRAKAAAHRAANPRIPKPRRSRDANNRWTRNYRAKQRLAVHQRLGGKCEACGWADDHRGLEVDHRVPLHRKTNGITVNGSPWKEILEHPDPLAEYALLCANCHVIKTLENGDNVADGAREVKPEADMQMGLFDGF